MLKGCNKIQGVALYKLKTKMLCSIFYFLVRTSIKFLSLFQNMKYLYNKNKRLIEKLIETLNCLQHKNVVILPYQSRDYERDIHI